MNYLLIIAFFFAGWMDILARFVKEPDRTMDAWLL